MNFQSQETSQTQESEERLKSLQEQLLSSEILYSRLLNELNSVNSYLRRENIRLLKSVSKKKEKINALIERERAAVEREKAAILEVERLKVGRVAFSQVIQALLRRIRVYRPLGKPSTTVTIGLPQTELLSESTQESKPETNESQAKIESLRLDNFGTSVQENLSSALVEALVVIQTINSGSSLDFDKDVIRFFEDILAERASILCISPSAESRIEILAQAFSCQGLEVTCIDVKSHLVRSLEASGVKVLKEELSSYLAKLDPSDLSAFNVICVSSELEKAELNLLRFRISPESKVIVGYSADSDRLSSDTVISLDFSAKVKDDDGSELRGLHLHSTPPPELLNPLHTSSEVCSGQLWPWNYPTLEASDKMPTGRPWPKISVITVTRNQGEYLEETIRSVLMQGYPNLEYIVLDGCSTDNTLEVLDRYRKDLTFCVSEPDSGQANALNKGFNRATGDILAWLNSDDCYLPFALFRVALAFDLYKTDLIVGGCQLRKDFSLSAFKTHHSAFRYGEVTDLPLERLLDIENCWQKGEFFYQPEVFWTQDIWNRVGGRVREDLFYSMDYELWVRMAKEGAKLLHIPDALALYRVHERQKTFGDEPPFLQELKAVAEKLKKDYRV